MKKVFITAFLTVTIPVLALSVGDVTKIEIMKVFDGDTVLIKTEQDPVSLRLYGIDCFETSPNNHIKYQKTPDITYEEIMEKGLEAKCELENVIKNKEIYLELKGMDKKYSRLVGVLYYKKGKNFININKYMEETGLCPKYVHKTKNCSKG